MFILITYDVKVDTIDGRRRLQHVSKECKNYGHRVQNSVFECVLKEEEFIILRSKIENIIDKKNDSVRFYFLGKNWKGRIEHLGKETAIDVTETLII